MTKIPSGIFTNGPVTLLFICHNLTGAFRRGRPEIAKTLANPTPLCRRFCGRCKILQHFLGKILVLSGGKISFIIMV